MDDLFNLPQAQQREAQRRLQMLGAFADTDFSPQQLREFARERVIPVRYLIAWKHQYQRGGLDGLLPQDWEPFSIEDQHLICERLAQLGDLATALTISPEEILQLAERLACSHSTAMRLLHRYRIEGIRGLTRTGNPERYPSHPSPPLPLASVDITTVIDEIERKRALLGEDLLHKIEAGDMISREEVVNRAREVGKSQSLLWDYIKSLRTYGNAGLTSRTRQDKGRHHNLSERMKNIILGIRLSHPDCPVREVQAKASQRAQWLGEPEPSLWHVRSLCEQIPSEVKAIADGRENRFRNYYRYTYRRHFDGSYIVYQLDATQIDMLVKDIRTRGHTKSKEVRPWLTQCIESSTGIVMAAALSYDPPNQHTIAAVIRDALLITEEKPFGGVPDAIWVDKGKAMIAKHIYTLTRELGIELHDCLTPEEKGKIERSFKTLNTRLWSRVEGYVSSSVKERNPKAKAAYTITELDALYWRFVKQYHEEFCADCGMSRLQAWKETCFTLPPDPRILDVLLQVRTEHKVTKEGIHHAGRVYWHPELLDHVYISDPVIVRAAPNEMHPNTIEVYRAVLHPLPDALPASTRAPEHIGEWICTAFARDSEQGKAVTGPQVVFAQRLQRRKNKEVITGARSFLKEVDAQIAETHPSSDRNTPGMDGAKQESQSLDSQQFNQTASEKQVDAFPSVQQMPTVEDQTTQEEHAPCSLKPSAPEEKGAETAPPPGKTARPGSNQPEQPTPRRSRSTSRGNAWGKLGQAIEHRHHDQGET